MPHNAPRVAILGAGPIGLEAALAAAEGRWRFDHVVGLLGAER
jgi:NADPH-dependent 2,4-dienoyl-CoA reductase/sulfur reductase-like enzyme